MKILFAGPTLYGRIADRRIDRISTIEVRAPAAQGDIARAVLEGATAIGLVDGRFEDVAAPWHKEILYGLSKGVHVLGAASMGALRAAECAAFGMVPIGTIAARYLTGALTNDGAVAQSHGPAELNFLPLTEALVNVEATLDAMAAGEWLSGTEAARLLSAARTLFFKTRTLDQLVARAGFDDPERVLALMRRHAVNVKRADALLLVDALAALPDSRQALPSWSFHEPRIWRAFIGTLEQQMSARGESGA